MVKKILSSGRVKKKKYALTCSFLPTGHNLFRKYLTITNYSSKFLSENALKWKLWLQIKILFYKQRKWLFYHEVSVI